MIEVRETPIFTKWLDKLKDQKAVLQIARRIQRMANGNPGDSKSLGEGVSEMRIDYGPGYRVYFARHGKTIVVLLCGGDKSTQDKDIRRAKELAGELED